MIKAIIFDFDGLILDTETLWFECYKEVLRQYDLDLSLSIFSQVIGTTNEKFDEYIQEKLQDRVSLETIYEQARALHEEKRQHLDLREGVLEYLKEAKELGLRIGLATSSSMAWITPFLERFNIRSYFDSIKTRDDVTKVKPDPELYLKTLDALGVEPTEAIVFEDSLNGSQAAIRAGIPCVIVPNPVTKDLEFKDYALMIESMGKHSLKEIIDQIENLDK